MSDEPRDTLYLAHIAETIDLIQSTLPTPVRKMILDPNLRDATLYRLQTLSESAQLLSEETKARHPEIPSSAIGGFRNRLAHRYVSIRFERVWQVLEHDLAPLRDAVVAELDRAKQQERTRDTGLDIGF